MITRLKPGLAFFCVLLLSVLICHANASTGDKIPEFRQCVEVCKQENCAYGRATSIRRSLLPDCCPWLTSTALLHRLLFWNCPQECDYTCQHIITFGRVDAGERIVQFHGKWPFYRFMGMQEPCSVLFSLLNFLAHQDGLAKVRKNIPSSYSLRKYQVQLSYFGMAAWVFSMIFHTRDFTATEQLDYFAAGASVLYGLYYAVIRVFRLDLGGEKTHSILRAWTALCILMYMGHVTYLKWYSWNYTYNMAANVVVGILQNLLWSWFSITKFRKSGRAWVTWPGMAVAWVMLAMSFELLDFPPLWGYLDAHSLWHLGTVIPTWIWYQFLLKDAQDDIAAARLKA